MIFEDRDAAGRALADEIGQRMPDGPGQERPLVLALPRGGVPVAVPVAERLAADLDVVIARKIGAPGRPEYGIGAIAEDGPPVFDPTALKYLGITEEDLADTIAAERANWPADCTVTAPDARCRTSPGARSCWSTTVWPPVSPRTPRCAGCAPGNRGG